MNPTLFSALPSVALARMALLFDQGLLSSPCTTRAQWEARVGNAALKCAPGNVAGVPSLPALDITDFYQHHTTANDVPDAAWFTTTLTFGMMSDKDGVPWAALNMLYMVGSPFLEDSRRLPHGRFVSVSSLLRDTLVQYGHGVLKARPEPRDILAGHHISRWILRARWPSTLDSMVLTPSIPDVVEDITMAMEYHYGIADRKLSVICDRFDFVIKHFSALRFLLKKCLSSCELFEQYSRVVTHCLKKADLHLLSTVTVANEYVEKK